VKSVELKDYIKKTIYPSDAAYIFNGSDVFCYDVKNNQWSIGDLLNRAYVPQGSSLITLEHSLFEEKDGNFDHIPACSIIISGGINLLTKQVYDSVTGLSLLED
jgi:hypothetical protein